MATPKKSPSMLDRMKAYVSPGSTAGKLRDADKKRQEALKSMGAKAKSKTRNA